MYRERSSIHLAVFTALVMGAGIHSSISVADIPDMSFGFNPLGFPKNTLKKSGKETTEMKVVNKSNKKKKNKKKKTKDDTEVVTPEIKKEEPKKEISFTGKPKDLRLSELKSLFTNFEIRRDPDGSVRAYGKFPKKCESLLAVGQPEKVPTGDRAGFQFHDNGGFVECVNANKGDTSGGLGDVPGTRIEASLLQSTSEIRVGIIAEDPTNERIKFAFEEYKGEGLPYKSFAYERESNKEKLEEKKLAKVEKLKDVIAKCQGTLPGLKIAKSKLDELLAMKINGRPVLVKKDYDTANNGLGDIELGLLKKAANKVKAEDMDGMLEDLGQFASRYPDRHDELSEVYMHLVQRFSDDASTQEEIATAQAILNDGEDVLTNISEKGERKIEEQRIGLRGAIVFAGAQSGLQNNPYLPMQIQMGQFQATNDVMKHCSSGGMSGGMMGMSGMGSMGMMGGMSSMGMTGMMNPYGAQNASNPGSSNGNSLCSAAMTSMQQIQLAYPRAMYTDYMQYQAMQQMQTQMYMAQQNPMMYAPLFNQMSGQSTAIPYGMNNINPYSQNGAMPTNTMQQNQLFSPQGTLINTPPIHF